MNNMKDTKEIMNEIDDKLLLHYELGYVNNLKKQNKELQDRIDKGLEYTNYLIKNMGLDSYYMEKIYLEKHITKFLSILDKKGNE